MASFSSVWNLELECLHSDAEAEPCQDHVQTDVDGDNNVENDIDLDGLDLTEIFELPIQDDIVDEQADESSQTWKFKALTEDNVLSAITSINHFKMSAETEVMKKNDICEDLSFLNELISHNKEKSWTKYHEKITELLKIKHVSYISSNIFPFFLLKVFSSILDSNFPNHQFSNVNFQNNHTDVNEIISYIGGFIISKLKQKFNKDKEGLRYLEYFQCPSDDINVAYPKLSKLKDRGALCYINLNFHKILTTLETIFLDQLKDANSVNKENFVNFGLLQCEDNFSECITESCSNENLFPIMHSVINMYFKIRIHHRCKILMQNQNPSKKGLRKMLKKS